MNAPPQEVKFPETPELLELLPLSVYARAVPRLGILADLREGVHPEVLACVGVLGRQITGNLRIRGKGVHHNALIKFSPDMMDYVSAALDACVRVKVQKVSGAR